MHKIPFETIAAWRGFFARADLPVLRASFDALTLLRQDENTNARHIAGVILDDPFMTVRLLAHLARTRSRRQVTDITTIEGTVMMLGMNKFYSAFEVVPIVEDELAAHPAALEGLTHVVARARNASTWARDWAARRNDFTYEEITISALLHDLSEMLVWCFLPALALEMKALQEAKPTLRSRIAQKAVLGIELGLLQVELVREWHLPELIITLMDDVHTTDPRVRNVMLAVNLARHADHGWHDPALADDYAAIGALLHLDAGRARALVMPEEQET